MSRRSSKRPRVVLPDPDSPTTATVCPWWMSSETPSTALTWRRGPASQPDSTGKYFLIPSARSRGSAELSVISVIEEAGNLPLRRILNPGRVLHNTQVHHVRAAGMEPTARRAIGQVRHAALNTRQLSAHTLPGGQRV